MDQEAERLQALESLQLRAGDVSQTIDDVAHLAASICGVSAAAVSIVDRDSVWLLTSYGIDAVATEREQAICSKTIEMGDVYHIEDVWQTPDLRPTADSPFAPYRFYAGVPLAAANGPYIGVLFVIDEQPKKLSTEQIDHLQRLARQTAMLFESRRAVLAAERSQQKLANLFSSMTDGYAKVDMSGKIIEINPAMCEMTGYSAEELYELSFVDLTPSKWHVFESQILEEQVLTRGHSRIYEKEYRRKDGTIVPVELRTFLICDDAGTPEAMWAIIRDISERKEAEAKIDESHKRFRAIFDQTYQFTGLMSPDGILLEANRSALAASEIAEDDVIGKPFWETPWWTHSSQLQAQLKDAVKRAATGEFVRFEATHPTSNKEAIIVDFSVKPVFDEAGEVTLLIPEGRDITERKRAEAELALKERRLSLAVDATSDAIWEWKIGEGMSYFSPRWLGMLGYTNDEFQLSRDVWRELCHPDDYGPAVEQIQRMLDDQTDGFEAEFRMRRKDGSWMWILGRGKIVERDASGKAILLAGTNSDITQRKNSELALIEREQMLAGIASTVPHVIYIVDVDYQNISYANRDFMEMLGYSPDQIRAFGDHPIDAIEVTEPLTMREPAAQRWDEIADGEVVEHESRYRDASGTLRTFLHRSTIYTRHPDGRPAQTLGTAVDITDRFRAEEALRLLNETLEKRVRERTEELEEKNRDLEQFSYTVSHDLRSPLRAIAGYSNIVIQDAGERLDPETRDFLSRIQTNAIRMAAMLDGILHYAKIGTRRPQFEAIGLRDHIEEVARFARTESQFSRTALYFDIADVEIRTDVEALSICLRNLIGNAMKFSSKRDKPEVWISAAVEGDVCTIAIRDNGVGLDLAHRRQIFQIFHRLDTSTDEGTGIGLALVSRAATRLHGTVDVHSELGAGATFTLSFPVLREETSPTAPPKEP